jgi:uncharacterized membrane protein
MEETLMHGSLLNPTAWRAWLAPRRQPQGVPTATRFWEVDILRGMAVVMMVIYHFMYDLYFFQVTNAIFTLPF